MAVFSTTTFNPYELTGVKVTDRKLGRGSYATVLELEYMGLKCAGKKIHEMLLKSNDATYTVCRFEEECRLLSQVRHPNIVQFLGVYFQKEEQVPILVMEFLPTNLTSCIKKHGVLPTEIGYSILHDVALGLCYLHGQIPPIIHRDLSSNNVLLTSNLTAKISDLGVARIFDLTPLQVSRMTQTPGTPAYMPPEVMIANPKYDTSADTFSYGIMMIHMFSGRWPVPQVEPIRIEPNGTMIPVSEAERRKVFLQAIGNDHPLTDLILQSINNDPRQRPHASEIVEQIAEMKLQFPTLSISPLEQIAEVQRKDIGTQTDIKMKTVSNSPFQLEVQRKDIGIQAEIKTSNSPFQDYSTSVPSDDSRTFSGDLKQSILSSKKDPSKIQDPVIIASDDTCSEPAYKAMIRCHDKLVTAFSTDIINISGILLANEFVPVELGSKMLLPNFTSQEKATIMVNAITDKIKVAPNRLQELIKIFSGETCTKDIVPSLLSAKDKKQGIGVSVSTDQQYAICGDHMYTAWASLDLDDKIDLEARLLTDAETIGVKFAHLFSMVRNSFEQRGITPQVLADTLVDLTVYKPGISFHDILPLLDEGGGSIMRAKSVRETFHALRPHISFFNNEILVYLTKRLGSDSDKVVLDTFLKDLETFCKRHVFEVPFTAYSKGGDHSMKPKQRLHVKVTEHFKSAFLVKSADDDESKANNVCSSKLGINLEDAKNIQRKFADILNLNPSSLFLDTIAEG